jgi:hypothetical protein
VVGGPGSGSGGSSGGSAGAPGSGPAGGGVPTIPVGPDRPDAPAIGGGFDGLVRSVAQAVERVGGAIRPDAAATVATTFGFPIALALLVLAFLLVQSRMDDRDPKLRSAPRTMADTLVAFVDEDAR